MEREKAYEDAVNDAYNQSFMERGEWVWPETVPEWAGGQVAQKEFYATLREAWVTSSDPKKRMLVAQHSGPEVWDRLVKDENEMVRAAVALAGNADVHRELASDSSQLVREYVADYGPPAVLRDMAGQEGSLDVLYHIAQRKDRPAQSILVERLWEQPDFLRKIVPLLSKAEKDHLLSHDDQTVRIRVGEYGNRRQARTVMEDGSIPEYEKLFVADRLQELEEISEALRPVPLRELDIRQELSR